MSGLNALALHSHSSWRFFEKLSKRASKWLMQITKSGTQSWKGGRCEGIWSVESSHNPPSTQSWIVYVVFFFFFFFLIFTQHLSTREIVQKAPSGEKWAMLSPSQSFYIPCALLFMKSFFPSTFFRFQTSLPRCMWREQKKKKNERFHFSHWLCSCHRL